MSAHPRMLTKLFWITVWWITLWGIYMQSILTQKSDLEDPFTLALFSVACLLTLPGFVYLCRKWIFNC